MFLKDKRILLAGILVGLALFFISFLFAGLTIVPLGTFGAVTIDGGGTPNSQGPATHDSTSANTRDELGHPKAIIPEECPADSVQYSSKQDYYSRGLPLGSISLSYNTAGTCVANPPAIYTIIVPNIILNLVFWLLLSLLLCQLISRYWLVHTSQTNTDLALHSETRRNLTHSFVLSVCVAVDVLTISWIAATANGDFGTSYDFLFLMIFTIVMPVFVLVRTKGPNKSPWQKFNFVASIVLLVPLALLACVIIALSVLLGSGSFLGG